MAIEDNVPGDGINYKLGLVITDTNPQCTDNAICCMAAQLVPP
jgi:hypothetical protein